MFDYVAFKIAGSALIIGATTLAGFYYSKKDAIREEQLLEMKKALIILKNEIRFQLSVFGEAAISIAERVKSPIADIFRYSGEGALSKKGGDAFEIWAQAIHNIENEAFFSKEDINELKAMGKNLGYLDKDMQTQSIDMLIEYIDVAVEGIRENRVNQSKMYRNLGFLSGLLITVILL